MKPRHPTETHALHMEARLRHLGATLDDLVAKAEAVGDEVQVEYREGIEELRENLRAAQSRIDALRGSGDECWETVKTGVEKAWHELEVAFRKVAER